MISDTFYLDSYEKKCGNIVCSWENNENNDKLSWNFYKVNYLELSCGREQMTASIQDNSLAE